MCGLQKEYLEEILIILSIRKITQYDLRDFKWTGHHQSCFPINLTKYFRREKIANANINSLMTDVPII